MGTALTERTTSLILRLRNRHFFFLDLVLLILIPFAALELRVDGALQDEQYLQFVIIYSLTCLPFWLGAFLLCGLYSHYWPYASIDEAATIVKAVLLGTILTAAWFFLGLQPLGLVPDSFPRSLPLIGGMLVFLAIGLTRFSVRFVDRLQHRRQAKGGASKPVVIFGAGHAGDLIAREMQTNPQLGLYPVAFLDDDPHKKHTVIRGLPVIGGRAALPSVARDYHAREVIIAMPTVGGKLIREITALCQENGLTVKTVPGMFELLDGSVTANKVRKVEIEDLLRREPVSTEPIIASELVMGKRVLVTGAGGSIGSELCRQIARALPAELTLLGHGENSLFFAGRDLAATYPNLTLNTVVADVRDKPRLNAVMARYKPELVFHAAAHKHVSLMENNVEDAVTNNVQGTRTVVDAALAAGVDTFVMISTDKAVNPVSVMGTTKRVAELYVHARALESGRRFVAVRFGNVLGSNGSVVPLFRQQIANGGPVQVTHPSVRRFFMTIPEAVQLVLQAATLGKGGEIFALDMGEPVRIVDLAEDMIRLSGLKLGQDIEIEFTGLRPGEKLYEELVVPGESFERTAREKIFVARNGLRPPPEVHVALYAAMDELVARAQAGDTAGVRAQLAMLVPEYHTPEVSA